MGLYKRCEHKGRQRDRCQCPWWGSFRKDRVSLSKWANQDVGSKDAARAILDEMRAAVRAGTFDPKGRTVAPPAVEALTFRKFAKKFFEREVAGRPSAETTGYRLPRLIAYFGDRPLKDITASDAEDFLETLRQPARFHPKHKADRVRQPSTLNRWRALLVRMFSWAVEKDYLERSPFNKPGIRKSLVGRSQENDPRSRRLVGDEATRLVNAANPMLKLFIKIAIHTGMRRGEMLALTWADLEARPGWIHLKAQNTKAKKERYIPIHPTVQAVLDFLRMDANGKKKPLHAAVFSNEVGEPIKGFATAWKNARKKADLVDFRWHDLRREFGSRLLEAGGHLIQAQELLGHSDPKMTRRYLNLGDESLMTAVSRLKDPTETPTPAEAIPDQSEDSHSLHNPAEVEPDTQSGPATNQLVS